MRPKSEIFKFELLVPSKVQLQKSGTVFQPRMTSYATLRRLSRIGKQYANMLEEYDTWSQVFDQTFEVLLTAARSSELPTRWSSSCQGKRVKSVLTIRLLLNFEQSQTDLRGIRRTSIPRQYGLASFIKCCRIFNTTPTTVSLKNVASDIFSALVARKGMPIFPNGHRGLPFRACVCTG